MQRFKIFGLWILLSSLSYCWTTPATTESRIIGPKKGVITSNSQYYSSIPVAAETLRSDLKRMQVTLDRMADDLEKLESRWSRRNDAIDDTLEINALGSIPNQRNAIIASEKLERIAKIQTRNSRLINMQMEALTNLETSIDSLMNSRRQSTESNDQANGTSFTSYQRQVVDRLTSIDAKLNRLPRESGNESIARGDDNDKNYRKERRNGKSSGEGTFDDRDDRSVPNYTKTAKISVPSCETLKDSALRSGVYTVERHMEFIWGNASSILCDATTDGGGWTVIQKRGPTRGAPINFTRSWNDYANGFGNLLDEFWLGNEIVHRMTLYNGPHELRIELEDWDGERVWAQYSNFQLGTSEDNYRIKVAGYTGNATDSLSAHDSTLFSTFDRRNDLAPRCCPCTSDYGGGWWYYSCFEANLNGDYYMKDQYRKPFRGIIWEHWRGNYSLKSSIMMIRSRSFTMKKQTKRAY